jgi:hypothetical protein
MEVKKDGRRCGVWEDRGLRVSMRRRDSVGVG